MNFKASTNRWLETKFEVAFSREKIIYVHCIRFIFIMYSSNPFSSI